MKLLALLSTALALHRATATLGYSTYAELDEGADNSGTTTYSPLDRSTTLFLYIQILAGSDHSALIADVQTLAANYAPHGIQLVPRVRYGPVTDSSVATEPDDEATLMADVAQWARVFADLRSTISIPVLQAGFLGQWGEWHDGPFCTAQGGADTPDNQRIKANVVEELLGSGLKVAVRYPADHRLLFDGNATVTIHDDCIFNEGATGTDGYTFPPDQHDALVAYTKQVAKGNTFGGEPCSIGGDGAVDWSDYALVCDATTGLAAYVEDMGIAYLNPSNPPEFKALFEDPDWRDCADNIQAALERNT